MKYISVPTLVNGKEVVKKEVVYNVNDFPYELLNTLPTVRKSGKSEYYNISCAFDIEATTIEPPKDSDGKYKYNPFAFMYHWQLCINNKVVFGRRWEEFQEFINNLVYYMDISQGKRLVIYVHNLSYEFQFIKNFIEIESMFCKDKKKPMKILCTNGIEFRCSYFLSNMSLAKFCENSQGVTHYKLTDTYDYRKLRTPDTILTQEEEGYCFNDVKGLCECIDSLLEVDNVVSIPLTNTGFVRREFRHAMNTKKNRSLFLRLQLNSENYKMCKRAFRGGNTHANRFLAGCIIPFVFSFDISSSYPACIMMDDYPMSAFMEVQLNNQQKLDYYCANYCVVMDVTFKNIALNSDEVIPYIDIAHCWEKVGVKNDNGRVLEADYITLTLTNIDLDIIRKTYHFDGFKVRRAIYARKGKLPIEMRETMMNFFRLKTMLKNVDGKEYEYMKSKNKLNSTFGMCVTAIDHSEIIYNQNTFEWTENEPNLDEALADFYKSRNNFLSYQWGIFVTANARKRLQTMLDIVKDDVVYIDTDSIKFVNEKHVAEFEALNEELRRIAEQNDLPSFVDRDGERFYLGTWDNDGNYERFKTLGAKKYCYDIKEKKDIPEKGIKKGDITFHITVSGMSKKDGAKAVGCIENFKIGETYKNIGRTTSWYNDTFTEKITINGCTFTTGSNIGILDTTYTLGVTNEYWELIADNMI